MLHDVLWDGNAKLEWSVYTDPKAALSSDPNTLSCLFYYGRPQGCARDDPTQRRQKPWVALQQN